MPALLQMMAAVRCKKSKWLFILGTLLGKHWDEDELFHSAEEVGSRLGNTPRSCIHARSITMLLTCAEDWCQKRIVHHCPDESQTAALLPEQVHPRPAAVLAQYRDAVAAARPGDPRDLALARQFVLPGRCASVHCGTAAHPPRPTRAALDMQQECWLTRLQNISACLKLLG